MNIDSGKCFSCGAILKVWRVAFTIDGQSVFIGSSCAKKTARSGSAGWQPDRGGPRLFISRVPPGLRALCEDHEKKEIK